MKVRLQSLPANVSGTDRTIKEIARLIEHDLKDQRLRVYVSQILHGVSSKDYVAELERLYSWIVQNVRFQKDPISIETVQSPLFTLRLRAGDCDDHAALMAGMAAAAGLSYRFRVVGYDVDRLLHIWPEIQVNGQWISADTTEPRYGFGWRPPIFPIERVYNFKGDVTNMAALSDVLPVTRRQVTDAIQTSVFNVLTENWRNGVINDSDLVSYLDVIDKQNFPSKSPVLVNPTRAAIEAFRQWAPANLGPAIKQGISGLSGLEGFLGSVWNAVKGAVGTVVGTAAKVLGVSTPSQVIVQPTVSIPPGTVQTTVTPAAAQSAVTEFLKSPVVLIGGGILLLLLFKQTSVQPRRRRR
jgi:hypothetical protein